MLKLSTVATALVTVAVMASGCTSSQHDSQAKGSSSPPSSTSSTGDGSLSCDVAKVKGTYLYEIHGDEEFTTGALPYLEVGLMSFDGSGALTRRGTSSEGHGEQRTEMRYTVGSDCIGTMTTATGGVYRTTVSPTGDTVTFFAAGTSHVQTALDGEADRVSALSDPTCSAATLAGTYLYRARGTVAGSIHIEHGFEVYDTGSVRNAFRVAGEDVEHTLAGTYSLGADCHATVTYPAGVRIDQYLSPSGDQLYWVQTGGLKQTDMFGGHETRVSRSMDSAVLGGTS